MSEAEQLILDFGRGRRDADALSAAGIVIEQSDAGTVIENPARHVVTAHPADVAEGLLRLASDPIRLPHWATVLLAGSSFVHLDLDDAGYGEVLLEGLWDLSAGEPVRAAALRVAKELRV